MNISRDEIKLAGDLSGTDKVTHHGYERFYSDFLNRSKICNQILEIGYGEGKSIKFWKQIFPNSFLNIIDLVKSEIGKGYQVFKCDQSSLKDLKKIEKELGSRSIDLIIDDGSHIPEHIILTFNLFFKSLLNENCTYIIEDIETSYWTNSECYGYPTNYGIDSKKSIVNSFFVLTHWLNREFLREKQKNNLEKKIKSIGFNIDTVNSIRSITFGHNCICINKNSKDDLKYLDRDYRWKLKLNRFININMFKTKKLKNFLIKLKIYNLIKKG